MRQTLFRYTALRGLYGQSNGCKNLSKKHKTTAGMIPKMGLFDSFIRNLHHVGTSKNNEAEVIALV